MAEYARILTPEQVRLEREYRVREARERDGKGLRERDDAEKAIVRAIVGLASKYDAMGELMAMDDITIPSLQSLAESKGVSLSDWGELISTITPMKWQLEAVVGLTWAECWQGLKSRFAQWMAEVTEN